MAHRRLHGPLIHRAETDPEAARDTNSDQDGDLQKKVMAFIVMTYTVMAFTVMAHIVMAYIVVVYIVVVCIVMAYIVMAHMYWPI